ncbi:MAG: hypothetical protein KDC26_03285 [Armatimonadetes bacterium]|nr:hypothetical protein [Armatimonadota bacterium]
MPEQPFFQVPINLSHAATVATRIVSRLVENLPSKHESEALSQAEFLVSELLPYRIDPEEPAPAEAMVVQAHCLDIARHLVTLIREEKLQSDRVGQSVRNLFECLGAGREGSVKGLEAGEDPSSPQRPT